MKGKKGRINDWGERYKGKKGWRNAGGERYKGKKGGRKAGGGGDTKVTKMSKFKEIR